MNDSKVLNEEKTDIVKTDVTTTTVTPKEEVNTSMSTLKVDEKDNNVKEDDSNLPLVIDKEEKDDDMHLTHLNKEFVYDLMSVPTLSRYEYRMVTYIMLWAKKNGIKYEFDEYGNIYLTKGEVEEGEYYPCVTAHLDTVQSKQQAYILAGVNLQVKTRIVKDKHEIYVDGMGIGGDDKAGILIGLTMFSHVDKLKACFFLEEEIGCVGSKHLNADWFNDVGYVLGYDSPDLNRAAWCCSGTKLFSANFFKEHMQEICKEHGLDTFYSEPITDVMNIRPATHIICMNFGSGYYNCHSSNEYCVIEDMDNACRMGHALIKHLGNKQYLLEHKEKSYGHYEGNLWVRNIDEDEDFLKSLGDNSRGYGGYGTRNYSSHTNTTTTMTNVYNSTDYKPKTAEKKGDEVPLETVRYISEKYDEYIESIKNDIKSHCESLNIDFDAEFGKYFETAIQF